MPQGGGVFDATTEAVNIGFSVTDLWLTLASFWNILVTLWTTLATFRHSLGTRKTLYLLFLAQK
jgi:hypothetical protein